MQIWYQFEDYFEWVRRLSSSLGFVQGGGGNASLKVDGEMLVKASGSSMKEFSPATAVVVELNEVIGSFRKGEPYVHSESSRRPSIETSMHAVIPQKYVVHFHYLGAMRDLLVGDLDDRPRVPAALKVPYRKPGYELTGAIEACLDEADNPASGVLFLMNHGIVAFADELDNLKDIIATLVQAYPFNEERYSSLCEIVWKKVTQGTSSVHVRTFGPSFEAIWAGIERIRDYWAITPDHLVFLGSEVTVVNSNTETVDGGSPQVHWKPGHVVFNVNIPSPAVEQFIAWIACIDLLENDDSINLLSRIEVDDVINWEAEKFRKRLAKL